MGIKAILRSFELTLGLRVNFHTSSLIEINVESSFLELAEDFLNCKIQTLPFRYLGLLVVSNPQMVSTWEH